MSLQIILKNSSVVGKEPTASQLANGELALNYNADGPFITCKDSAGTIRRVAGVWISNTAPASPTPGEFWLDTNTTPASLKVYKDGVDTWVNTVGISPASTTVAGIVELATNGETQTGTDALRAVTPASLQSKISDSTSTASATTIASSQAVKSASDVANAALPKAGGTVTGNLTVSGDLTVNGTTTTIDTTTLIVEDKNIEMGAVATPTDATADGGGITLKGSTDKTINWVDSTDAWTFSEHVNIVSGKEYRIAGTSVLNATTLGSGVTGSSLTSVGTITSGTWNGTAITNAYIGADAIDGTKIADDSIDSEHYADGSIDTIHIADSQITSVKIADGTIVNADVNASAAIAGTKIDPDFGSQDVTTTGSVGIGLSSPAYPLDVSGNMRMGSSTGYGLIQYGSSSTATENWHVGSEGDGYFNFYNGVIGAGTNRLAISSGGNVGIGTNSPATPFHVFSNNVITDSPASSSVSQLRYGNSNTTVLFGVSSTAGHISAYDTSDFNNERNLILNRNGGNVGINAATPAYPLDVLSNTSAIGINIRGRSSDNISALNFRSNDNSSLYGVVQGRADEFRLASGTSSIPMTFRTNGEAARFDTSSRFLIGTSASRSNNIADPQFQLEGTATSASSLSIFRNFLNTTNEAPAYLLLGRSGASSFGSDAIVANGNRLGEIRFSGADGAGEALAARIYAEVDDTPGDNDMPGRMIFATTSNGAASSTERMRIDSRGHVGIGTTNPQALLECGDSSDDIQARFGTLSTARDCIIRLQGRNTADTTNCFADIKLDANSQTLLLTDPGTSSGNIGTNPVAISNTGLVGIGKTNPARPLDIQGSSGQLIVAESLSGSAIIRVDAQQTAGEEAYFWARSSTTGEGRLQFGTDIDGDVGWIKYDHSNDSMSFRVDGSTAMTIKDNGNIEFPDTTSLYQPGGGIYIGNSGLFSSDSSGTVSDNTENLGSNAYRWKTVYAVTGTINTSDVSLKQDIEDLNAAELTAARAIKGLIKKYRFTDAINAKGDDARVHVGVIAQEVEQVFLDAGLDASRYALFCRDTWYEVDGSAIDSEGNEFTVDTPGAVEKTRLGIRYSELLAFVIAAL